MVHALHAEHFNGESAMALEELTVGPAAGQRY